MLDVGYIVIDGGNTPCLSQCYCYSLLPFTDTRQSKRIISYRLNPSQLVIEGQTDCSHTFMSLYFWLYIHLASLSIEEDPEWGFAK